MAFSAPGTTLVQYSPCLYALDQGFVRCFLILGTTGALLLDTGAAPCDILSLVRSVTDLPLTVVNTHGDGDHTANNSAFPRVYLHPDEASVLRMFGQDLPFAPLTDGQVFDLGNRRLEIIHVPGHTPGSICLLDRDNRMLFSGDTVQRDSVFLFGPHRRPRLFPDALRRLQELSPAFDTVWPCHGPCPVEPDTIPALLDCYLSAASGQLDPQTPEMPLPPGASAQLFCKNGCSVLL